MVGGPIELEWNLVLGGEAASSPPPELEVISSSSPPVSSADEYETASSDAEDYKQWDDNKLRCQIQRIRGTFPSVAGKLKDGGAKLRLWQEKLEEELGRREKRDNDSRTRKNAAQPATEDPFAWQDESGLSSKSYELLSESSRFRSTKNNCCRDKVHTPAFESEINYLLPDRCSTSQKGRRREPIPVQKMYSSRQSYVTSVGPQQRSRAADPVCIDQNNVLDGQRNSSTHSTKKAKFSNYQDSSSFEFEKVQEVVLLDDEDATPAETIESDIHDKPKELKIYYPSRRDQEAVELTSSDIKCLEPEQYLSSPVINFYIQYLKRTSPEGGAEGRFHIFNTYFYSKLEEALSEMGDHTAQFMKLRRWWKGVHIFHKAYIILPIHGKMHWSLIIICIPEKYSKSGPIVLHLDSLRLHSSDEIFGTIRRYLEEEWRYIKQNAPSDLPTTEMTWKHLPNFIRTEQISVPQQQNEYDCGVFMLYYIERFIREAPERFRREGLDMFGRKWFKPEEAAELRRRIRELLVEEFESVMVDDGLDVSEAGTPSLSSGSDDNEDIIMT